VKIRSHHTLRALAAAYDVTALCFHRAKTAAETQDLRRRCDALRPYARVHAYPIAQLHSRTRLWWDHLRSLTRSRVYTAYLYSSYAFRHKLREELEKGDVSLVHVDSLDLGAYLPLVRDVPVVCVHHNHESMLLRRRARFESSRLRAAYLTHQANLMEREESRWCPRVDLNVVVSEGDRRTLSETAPGARFLVVPNGVDTAVFRPPAGPNPDEAGVVFVGGTTWFPNRDALRFFTEEIQPLIPEGTVRRVEWVGRCSSAERELFAKRHSVTMTGYVQDIRPLVWRAACYVVPLRVGGGTRLKILEAWAMGKAIVSTSVGCEGLATEDGVNILIRDDPASFARAITEVVRNPALRAHLGRNARATAERMYAREVLAHELVEEYAKLVAHWRGGGPTSHRHDHRHDEWAE
jgi:glycosyltransferase involved in cell wall biosynthesis